MEIWNAPPRFHIPHAPQEYYGQVSNEASNERSIDRLTSATHPIVPVHEGTLWVFLPGPDVQLEECGDVEAIRGVDKIEDLPLEHRGSVVILGEPGRRVQDELDAHECHLAIGRLVDECLRLRGV